jgi:DNA polymerase-3 subunit gamma/tau
MAAPKVLTLKYRPQTFDELWIQDHVRDTLKRAIERNRLANAYLLCGPRGVGKTTTARILAKALNCEQGPTPNPCGKCPSCVEIAAARSLDVIEIDGASNRKIDDVRDLRENIKYTPSSGRFKIYIIDEVHMLTSEAFNALLKTLEEPPAHAKFVFATTAPQDLPPTIISRCQRFDFRKATAKEVQERLAWLAEQEGIKVSAKALMAIARRADGAIRDGESVLGQMAAYKPEGIEASDVEELLGLVPADLFYDYSGLLLTGDGRALLDFLAALFDKGYDYHEFYTGLVQHFRDLLILEVGASATGLSLLPDEASRMTEQAGRFGRDGLLKTLGVLTGYEAVARNTRHPRILIEVMTLELAAPRAAAGDRKPRSASPLHDEPPAAADRPLSMESLWSALRLRCNEHKPVLASFLDQARPVALDADTLSVELPAKERLPAEQIAAGARTLDAILTEAAGRPMKLAVRFTRRPGPDPVKDRVTKILGDVEEEGRS